MSRPLWSIRSGSPSKDKLERFVKEHREAIVTALVCAAVVVVGLHFRSYPLERNISRKNREFTRMLVLNHLRTNMREELRSEYPDLPRMERERMLNRQFPERVKSERRGIEQATRGLYRGSYRDPDSQPFRFYLLGADGYYYYGLTKRLIDTGRISDTARDGKYLDRRMMAPEGHWRHIELHPFTGYLLYRFISFFNRSFTPMRACAWATALLYAMTAALLCGWLVHKGVSRHIAFISGVFFSLSPIFLQRSCVGWYDTDVYNVLFPLLAIIALDKFLDSRRVISSALPLAAACALFALFWEGWIFLTLMVHVVLAVFVLRAARKGTKRDRSLLIRKIGIYSAGTFTLAAVLITPAGVVHAFTNITDIVMDFLMLRYSVWPNLFLMVGELKEVQLVKAFHMLGGYFFVLSGLAGSVLLALRKSSRFSEETSLALCTLFLLMFLFGISAERFLLFLVLPLSISFAVLYQAVFEYLGGKGLPEKAMYAGLALFYMTLAWPFVYGHAIARNQVPIFDRVWEEAMVKIRETTPEDAIINSWWPPGHFIKAVGERAVISDGATIQTPRAYWLGRALMSTDETHAMGILRMLNSSGLAAQDLLTDKGLAVHKAVSLIESMVSLEEREALRIASAALPADTARQLVELTHGEPAPAYLLLYKDLLDGVLGLHFVNRWDLGKSTEHVERQQEQPLIRRVLSRGTRADTVQLMWSLAGQRTYIGDPVYSYDVQDNTALFPNGLSVHLGAMEPYLENLEGAISGTPASIIFLRDGDIVEREPGNASLRLSVLLMEHAGQSYSSITAPREVLLSILFRLYYLDGAGTERFRKVLDTENPVLNNKAQVFEILWE